MRSSTRAYGRLSLALAGVIALLAAPVAAQEPRGGPAGAMGAPAVGPLRSNDDSLGRELKAQGLPTLSTLPVSPEIGMMAKGALSTEPPAFAERHPVVIELYTSQGCSACPPADALLAQISQRDDVIALALHVDYWDYIGWKDKFASPGFTKRQKAYARATGEHAIYTPQMIIAGQDQLVGLRPMQLTDLVESHGEKASHVRMTLTRTGDMLRLEAEARPALAKPVTIQLVRYRPEETVPIQSGENAGKVVRYSNIVTDWKPVGEWAGQGPMVLDMPAPGGDAAVVILQEQGPGAILAAEALR